MTMKVYSAVLLLSLGMEMTVGLHALPALTAGKSLPVTFEWGGGGGGCWVDPRRYLGIRGEKYFMLLRRILGRLSGR